MTHKISNKNSIETKKQFLPKSLEFLKETDTIIFKSKKLKTPFFVDILHDLILKYYFKKENSFNLSSLILKEKYGYLYNYYMDYLIENNHLCIIKNHQKGKNARIYKINEDLINGEIYRYNNKEKKIVERYIKSVTPIDSEYENNSIENNIKKRIIEDLYNIEIDYEKAMYYLDSIILDHDSYNKNKYSVETIKDKQIFYHFDCYGRVHTNFTTLKSFLRKNCLLINGEETYEIDISSSQIFFLCKLIKDNDCGIVNKEEFSFLKKLVISENFYQYIMDITNIKEKKECKKIIYKILFGKNKENKEIFFEKLFPTIYEFIKEYKKEMGDYKVLSHELQRYESNFLFNNLIKTIWIINPDINIITIHDSIIFQKKYKPIIDKIFDSKIQEEIYYFS
jgi:hypothetical protein